MLLGITLHAHEYIFPEMINYRRSIGWQESQSLSCVCL